MKRIRTSSMSNSPSVSHMPVSTHCARSSSPSPHSSSVPSQLHSLQQHDLDERLETGGLDVGRLTLGRIQERVQRRKLASTHASVLVPIAPICLVFALIPAHQWDTLLSSHVPILKCKLSEGFEGHWRFWENALRSRRSDGLVALASFIRSRSVVKSSPPIARFATSAG